MPPTVLLVDDTELVRGFARQLLHEAAFRVVEAANAAEALSIAAHPDQAIDILVSDLLLPDINGIELARKLRAIRPQLKVVLVSADPSNRAAAALIPDAAFLDKNEIVERLADQVTEMLRGRL